MAQLLSQQIIDQVLGAGSPEKIKVFRRFFKTQPGEYGFGDEFAGVTVPQARAIAQQFTSQASLSDVHELLVHEVHEVRLVGLLILTYQFHKQTDVAQKAIVQFYLQHTDRINNWDLVDLSVYKILGAWCVQQHEDSVLLQLANSKNMWERRMAMVGSFAYIKVGQLDLPIKIATMLCHDPHDLMHKAVGWMLREVGKKDQAVLESFLNLHGPTLPRTLLRYAIERFSEQKRRRYLIDTRTKKT